MSDRLAEIKSKCEQYLGYQGESVGISEVHAVLSFIHGRTIEAIAKIERLEAVLKAILVAPGFDQGMEAAAKMANDRALPLGTTTAAEVLFSLAAAIRAKIKT